MASLQPVHIDALPQSIEAFVALRDRTAVTPQGGAAMMVVALLLHAEDQELGQRCLTVAVDRGRLVEGSQGYKGWQLRRGDLSRITSQLARQPYVPQSYIEGATPENGYQLPAPPCRMAFSDNPHSGDAEAGPYKVFTACSGASSPRPVTVKRNNRGIWKASEWSSLIVGIMAPAQNEDDDL